MLTLLFLLVIATGLLGAYTMNFQKTTLSLGKMLAPDNEFLPNGLQDAITPRCQTIRNLLFPVLLLAIVPVGLFVMQWYYAILIALLAFGVVTPLCQQVVPRPESQHYLNSIKKALAKRVEVYKKANDATRGFAATSVLRDLEKILQSPS